MADLRQYLVNDSGAVVNTNREFQLAVYNTNTPDVTNGGQCCCWVVPAGITWAVFETWGGGGSGGGACCCMGHYYGPESGAYGKVQLRVTAGCYFCICAGGSGCCNTTCCGACGFPSWVNCGTGATVTCAAGGCGGCVLCFRSYQGCTGICFGMCRMGCDTGTVDYAAPKIMSQPKVSNYCWQNMFEFMAGPTKYGQNLRLGIEHCSTSLTISGCAPFGQARFPGGPGNSATACGGGCCWGSYGAGGLVVVNYG